CAQRVQHSFPTRRSSDLAARPPPDGGIPGAVAAGRAAGGSCRAAVSPSGPPRFAPGLRAVSEAYISQRGRAIKAMVVGANVLRIDRKSTRLNSSHVKISY